MERQKIGLIDRFDGIYLANRRVPCAWPSIVLLVLLSFSLLTQCGIDRTQNTNYLHPELSITEDHLEFLIAQLQQQSQMIAHLYPALFLNLIADTFQQPEALTLLVDKHYSLSASYKPHDLVSLDDYRNHLALNVEGMRVSAIIIPDLLAMVEEARLDGYELSISSAYRSYDYQALLYQRHVAELGEIEAQRVSAQAGHSQHQLGTALDFGSVSSAFNNTGAARWLENNGWRFGFSLSYPPHSEHLTGYRYESWHWRYIGRSAALLERYFFDGMQQAMLTFIERNRSLLTKNQIINKTQ